jgi:hypothetical protein
MEMPQLSTGLHSSAARPEMFVSRRSGPSPLVAFLIPISAATEWAAAIASFVRSLYIMDHRLVGIGHSAGNSAMSVTKFPPLSSADF